VVAENSRNAQRHGSLPGKRQQERRPLQLSKQSASRFTTALSPGAHGVAKRSGWPGSDEDSACAAPTAKAPKVAPQARSGMASWSMTARQRWPRQRGHAWTVVRQTRENTRAS